MAHDRERAINADMAATSYGARPSMGPKRHSIGLLLRGLAALALLAPVSVIAASPVAAAPLTASGACATGLANVGGQGIICDVTIVNTITLTGGSATVTVHECQGSYGEPTDGTMPGGHACTTTTTTEAAPVTDITQCDYSASGAGGKLLCSVVVTNNFTGGAVPGATAATVDQCIGSAGGGGAAIICSPLESTTSAAITQCNNSANGGGASITCTASGTMASALAVTINQCNYSANGGGALVVCTATITNNEVPLATPTPVAAPLATPTAIPTAASTMTPPATSTTGGGSSDNSAPLLPLMILLALSGLGLATVVAQRRHIQN